MHNGLGLHVSTCCVDDLSTESRRLDGSLSLIRALSSLDGCGKGARPTTSVHFLGCLDGGDRRVLCHVNFEVFDAMAGWRVPALCFSPVFGPTRCSRSVITIALGLQVLVELSPKKEIATSLNLLMHIDPQSALQDARVK